MKKIFSEEQIDFMKNLGININFNKILADDDLIYIEEFLADQIQFKGIEDGDQLNEFGKKCIQILDLLP